MNEVKFGEPWETCPIIDVCALPAICCYNCWKYQRVAHIEREAKREQEKARFQQTRPDMGRMSGKSEL